MAGFVETMSRGLYAAGGGDIAKYDQMKQEAELAKQKRADDAMKAQVENAKFQFEQQQQLQASGYQDIGKFPGGNPKDFQSISVPGGGQYFKPMIEQPKTYSDKIAALKLDAIKSMDPSAQKDYLLGQKPVDDMSAWRLANTLATAENGGSLMSGIGENKAAYEKSRQTWYEKLKKGVVAAGATDLTGKQSASDIDSY
jgi:hypothetical protein